MRPRSSCISGKDESWSCINSISAEWTPTENVAPMSRGEEVLGLHKRFLTFLFIKKQHFFLWKREMDRNMGENWSLSQNTFLGLFKPVLAPSFYLSHSGAQEDLCLKGLIAVYEHSLRTTASHSPSKLNIKTKFFSKEGKEGRKGGRQEREAGKKKGWEEKEEGREGDKAKQTSVFLQACCYYLGTFTLLLPSSLETLAPHSFPSLRSLLNAEAFLDNPI